MGASGDYRPAMAMLGLQCSYAGVAVFTGAALLQGMSPRGSVVYRQAMATLIIAPIAYFSRRKSRIPPLGFKSFSLIFLTALIVITINQNMFYEGLYLASSTMGTAMGNLIPAITFVLAAIVG
ncbi:WAT1-related protein [Citrus sinensis]|uniref:WAT1-related protein n=1 Tax=Citrus sinensis TaxID=2711 RepID=A0ACB8P703_CITSI|nr:WAT1-related protein [Citrus sinensis]